MTLWNSTHTREASTNYKGLLRTVRTHIKDFLESIKRGSFATSNEEVITHVRVMGTVRARVQLMPMLASFRTS